MVNIMVISSSDSLLQTSDIIATTISYNDFYDSLLRLTIRHQQVYNTLPSYFQLKYSHKLISYAPSMSFLKVYRSNYRDEEPQCYILYMIPLQNEINVTVNLTSENYCELIQPNQVSGKLS
jgi:hypothetical protein